VPGPRRTLQVLGFRVQGSGFRVQGSKFKVQGLEIGPEAWRGTVLRKSISAQICEQYVAQRVACSALTLVVWHYITNLSGIAGVALSSGGTSPVLPTFDTGPGCLLDRIGGVCRGLEWVVKRSYLTRCINKMVPEGPPPPHDRQLIVNYY